MRVIGTVGLAGSGKGEFATVAEELEIPVVTMGDVIRRECRERGLDPTDHHGEIARTLREEEGPDAIARRSLPLVESALEADDTVLVDGIRSDVEVDAFEDRFGDAFTLVGIEAPFEVRAERLLERNRDETDGVEGLRARDEREREFGLEAALERTDRTIENTGSLQSFRRKVREVLQQ